ncbi:MAG: iron ABC transporter substrate-binding protein [Chloroflexi bacterium]|nr:iron ABC transporter substrate-binding protein [Chloroflexota bacterium]
MGLLAACTGGGTTPPKPTTGAAAATSAPSSPAAAAAASPAAASPAAVSPAASPAAAASPSASVSPAAASPAPAASPVSAASPVAAAPVPASDVTLTLYNAQHVPLAEAWVADFTKLTGIKVNVRSGKDFELANQIVQEGAGSPADVFITENSPAMTVVANKGLFAQIDPATLAQVPPRFSSPSGDWTGMAARSTVLVYNPSLLPANSLPASIMELQQPEWKDRVGIAPAGADFQAIVSAVLQLKGTDATRDWLNGLKTNARLYQGNGAILRAVNAGEIPAGIIYHYYWYADRAESGANSSNAELHYFGHQDPGAFVSVSGAGVLKSSKHPREAQQFVAYLNGIQGQTLLANSKAMEYPIGINAPANPRLKPLDELDAPSVDVSKLNGPEVIELMQDAGLI